MTEVKSKLNSHIFMQDSTPVVAEKAFLLFFSRTSVLWSDPRADPTAGDTKHLVVDC